MTYWTLLYWQKRQIINHSNDRMGGYGNKKIRKFQGIKWIYCANLYFLVLVSTRRSSFWSSSNILAQYCKYINVALWFLLFQLFGHFSVIWFSIYLVLWMGFSGWAPLNLVLFFVNVATIHGRSFFYFGIFNFTYFSFMVMAVSRYRQSF